MEWSCHWTPDMMAKVFSLRPLLTTQIFHENMTNRQWVGDGEVQYRKTKWPNSRQYTKQMDQKDGYIFQSGNNKFTRMTENKIAGKTTDYQDGLNEHCFDRWICSTKAREKKTHLQTGVANNVLLHFWNNARLHRQITSSLICLIYFSSISSSSNFFNQDHIECKLTSSDPSAFPSLDLRGKFLHLLPISNVDKHCPVSQEQIPHRWLLQNWFLSKTWNSLPAQVFSFF